MHHAALSYDASSASGQKTPLAKLAELAHFLRGAGCRSSTSYRQQNVSLVTTQMRQMADPAAQVLQSKWLLKSEHTNVGSQEG